MAWAMETLQRYRRYADIRHAAMQTIDAPPDVPFATMGMRRVVRGVGRTFIALGVLILLFVAYQLWGTGLAEARSQRDLKREFAKSLAAVPSTTTTSAPDRQPPFDDSTTLPPLVPPPLPRVPPGDAVALINIPRIGVDKAIVEGVGVPDLKKGPGHYPGTPMPGHRGNVAIAGHRTTYGAPFNRIDELTANDEIVVTTRQGEFRYRVAEQKVVQPKDVSVLDASTDNRLTLTTCNPKYSARQRLIVVAKLQGRALGDSPPPKAEPKSPTSSTTVPADSQGLQEEEVPQAEAGLSGDSSARTPAILWGLMCALVAGLTWAAARWWHKWPAYILGTPVFALLLFVFFENFARLLPANI